VNTAVAANQKQMAEASGVEPTGDRITCRPPVLKIIQCVQMRDLYNQSVVVVDKAERGDITVRSEPSWRLAFICIVMFSLVVTLATRTFCGTTSHSTAVQSNSSQAMRQHMDRDAVRWAAPVAKMVVSEAPAFYPGVAPARPPHSTLLLEENLYNRPPPSC